MIIQNIVIYISNNDKLLLYYNTINLTYHDYSVEYLYIYYLSYMYQYKIQGYNIYLVTNHIQYINIIDIYTSIYDNYNNTYVIVYYIVIEYNNTF